MTSQRTQTPGESAAQSIRKIAFIANIILLVTFVILAVTQWMLMADAASHAIQERIAHGTWDDAPYAPQVNVLGLEAALTSDSAGSTKANEQTLDEVQFQIWADQNGLHNLGYHPPFWLNVMRNRASLPQDTILCYFDGSWLFYYLLEGSVNPNSKDHLPITIYIANMSPELAVAKRSLGIFAICAVLLSVLLQVIAARSARQEQQNIQRLSDFFANTSHELKTPLVAVQGYVDAMAENIIPPAEAQPVVEREVMRMKLLVEQILALSKADAGAQPVRFSSTDVAETVYDAMEDVLVEAEQKNIQLTPYIKRPPIMQTDEQLLYSVMINLLSNAVRHAACSIDVTLYEKNAAIYICVENDGEAPSAQDLPHVFDRFYSGYRGSTGIGLALAKEHAKLLGARLAVRVKNNQTFFELWLPVMR